MSQVRILFIDLRGDLGGGSVYLASFLKNLNQGKFESYTASPVGQFHSETYRRYSKETFELPYRQFSFSALGRLSQFVERHKVHLIHSHGRGAGVYGRLLARMSNLPVIHTFHGISEAQNSIRGWIELRFEKWLSSFTTRFIHVSPSEQEYALSLGISNEHRSLVIPNGIDIESFVRNEALRQDTRRQLNFSPDHFVIGCVARLDPCKRHEDLIEAMRHIVSKNSKVRLCFIGKGECEALIRKRVEKYQLSSLVRFIGEQHDLKPFYSAFDLFVLPSLHEGLPLTLLEALASNCPVVATDVRGNRDVVEHGKTGLLVPVKNPIKLADMIDRLIQNPELRAHLAHVGNQMVRERFSITNSVGQTEEIYLDLCQFPQFRRVALVHDWLFHMRGGEKVLEAMGELFPAAPIFSLFITPSKVSQSIRKHFLKASWLNRIPFIEQFYRYLLPIFPMVIRQFQLKDVDLVISSNHCVAKGIKKPASATHVCYCHTPMRYAWGFQKEYFGSYPGVLQSLIEKTTAWLQRWDLKSNSSVDRFIANSENVRKRIKQFYGRDAQVIYPPIQIAANSMQHSNLVATGYFLIVSALVPYKRVDIAVDAFNQLELPLVVIGNGPLEKFLKKRAKPNIKFLGWLADHQVAEYYRGCRALIFPTEEDFGMVPLEAMAYGKPVIAYAKGGALESVVSLEEGKGRATGIFFSQQSPESLSLAVKRFSEEQFDPDVIRNRVESFWIENFKLQFKLLIEEIQTLEHATATSS